MREPGSDGSLAVRLAPYLVVVAAVVVANGLYVLGIFDPNPLLSVSGLGNPVAGGLLAGRFTIDLNVGTTAQSFGHLAAMDLLHGTIPWWNPYEGVGAPLAGEMQGAVLFPPTLLLALPQGQLLFHMLLEAVTGMATYRLVARLGVARWIAVGAGCAFALNGTFAWLTNAPFNPVALLPLILLGVERARAAAETGTGGGYGLIAVALALSLYAGFPETAYLDGLFAVVWTAVRLHGLRWETLVRYVRKVAVGAVGGMLLAAPILVAFVDYLPRSYLGVNGGGFNGLSEPGAGIGTLFFPYLFGPIFGVTSLGPFWVDVGGYLTTTLLVLAVVGLWSRRLRALRFGLAAWILVALGRTYGIGPIQRAFDVLPGMNQVSVYRYVTPSMELACVVLAFLAIDDLRRRDVPRWAVFGAIAAAIGGALLTLVGGRRLVHEAAPGAQSHDWLLVSIVWGLGILAIAGVAAALLRGRLRTAVLVVLVLVDAAAMFVVPELSAPRGGQVDTAFVQWAKAHVGTGRLFTVGGVLYPDYGSYFQLPEADVHDLPVPKAYAHAIEHRLDSGTIPNDFDGTAVVGGPNAEGPIGALAAHMKTYEAIGVRYVAAYSGSGDASAVASLGLSPVYNDGYIEAFQLPDPAPMYSVAKASTPSGAAGTSSAPSCTVSHQHIDSVTVDCTGPATIVRRELWMPGWSANAGGHPLSVHAHGALFQSVDVPKGRTVVQFSFVPPHETPALGALVLGLLVVLASCLLGRRRVTRLPTRRGRLQADPDRDTATHPATSALPR